MNKRQYLDLLMTMPAAWIRASMANPSAYMRPIHVALHAIALRRIGSM